MHFELPIILHNVVYNCLDYAYMLSLLLTSENLIPYINGSYIYIAAIEPQIDNGISANHIYCDGYSYARGRGKKELLEQSSIPHWLVNNDIVKVLKNIIMDKCYSVVFVDEYYLPEAISGENGENTHFLHEELIYGFDDATSKFLALGLNRFGQYAKISHTYKDFEKAYMYGLDCTIHGDLSWAKQNRIMTFRISELYGQYPYSPSLLYSKFVRYLEGELLEDELYKWVNNQNSKIHVGFDYYKYYLQILSNSDNTLRSTDNIFHYAHHIYEHKKILHSVFNYLGRFTQNDNIISIADTYFDLIVKKATTLRNYSLKATQLKSIESEQIDHLANQTNYLVTQETEIFQKIISEMRTANHC